MISIIQVLAWDPVADTWLEVGAVSSKGAWQAIGVVIMQSMMLLRVVMTDDGKMMPSYHDLQVYLNSYHHSGLTSEVDLIFSVESGKYR